MKIREAHSAGGRRAGLLGGALAGCLLLQAPWTAAAQDVERTTHEANASEPQTSFEERGEQHILRQYQLGCLSHLSYLVVSAGEALVVDPQRDVEHYLSDAAELGATIRYVALTHPHADFVAGHTEIARKTGAEILIGAKARAEFPHRALSDGERVRIGALELEAWDTPGHTPNAQTFLLHAPGVKSDPAYALTGDTLFIGSIGRPDLLDVPPAQLASQSYDSVRRLAGLPEACLVLPAHGAGSLCGAHLSPATVSTIGAERATNPYLQIESRAAFIANVISHQPVAPQYFAFNVDLNRRGPPPVDDSAPLPAALAPEAFEAQLGQGAWVVDLRDAETYAAAHIRGAVNVSLRGRLDTWTGIVVPYDAPLCLVGSEEEVREGVFRLKRIGYDKVAGFLEGGMPAWRAAEKPVRSTRSMPPAELAAALRSHTEPLVIDVRTREEYEDLRLGEVGNIPVTESERFARTFPLDQPVLMVCNSAYRSSMAVGLAERMGFTDVGSLAGGLDAWIEAGLPVVGRQAPSTLAAARAAPQEAGALVLPEALEPAQLARFLMDQPQSYQLYDLRPAWQYAEWHVSGAENVAPEALAQKLSTLTPEKRAVLLDRDGTLAFAVAGAALALDPARELRVLAGGLERYYREVELRSAARPMVAEPVPAAAPAAPSKPVPAPKKRNAGC